MRSVMAVLRRLVECALSVRRGTKPSRRPPWEQYTSAPTQAEGGSVSYNLYVFLMWIRYYMYLIFYFV